MKSNPILLAAALCLGLAHPDAVAQDTTRARSMSAGLANFRAQSLAWRKADQLFNAQRFGEAIDLYLDANAVIANNPALDYKLGLAYMQTLQNDKALFHLGEAAKADPPVSENVDYWMALAYHRNYDYQNALRHMRAYRAAQSQWLDEAFEAQLTRFEDECLFGIVLLQDTLSVMMRPLDELNTQGPEYAPVASPDGSMLLLAQRKDGSLGDLESASDRMHYEDIFVAELQGERFAQPRNLGRPVNTRNHDAALSFSFDGQQLFLYNARQQGDIFVATKGPQGNWQKPEPLPEPINSRAREHSFALHPDGKTAFFTSDRGGNMDIYTSRRDEQGNWSEPVALGPQANTPEEEMSVRICQDGKKLYFSSKGHQTLGGFDIFVCPLQDDGQWGQAQNLGYPINSSQHDIYFSPVGPNQAFYATVGDGSEHNYNLFQVIFTEGQQPVKFDQGLMEQLAQAVEKGESIDQVLAATRPEPAEVASTENAAEQTASTEPATGASDQEQDVETPTTTTATTTTTTVATTAEPAPVLPSKVFEASTYGFNLTAPPSSLVEKLDRLALLLARVPGSSVSLIGHTDNVGSEEVNIVVGRQRAQGAADLLMAKGVSGSQIKVLSEGEAKPIDTNDTPEGRARNRRVEIIFHE